MVCGYTSNLGERFFLPVLPFRCSLVSERSCDLDGALPAELPVLVCVRVRFSGQGRRPFIATSNCRPVGLSVTGAIDGGRREKFAITTIAALVIPSY